MTKCSVIVAKLSQKNPRCPKNSSCPKIQPELLLLLLGGFQEEGGENKAKKADLGCQRKQEIRPIPRDRGAQGPGTNPRGIAGSGALPTAPRASQQSCSSQCWGESEQLGRKTEILVSSERFVGFSRWGKGRLGVQVLNSNPLRALWEFLYPVVSVGFKVPF